MDLHAHIVYFFATEHRHTYFPDVELMGKSFIGGLLSLFFCKSSQRTEHLELFECPDGQ